LFGEAEEVTMRPALVLFATLGLLLSSCWQVLADESLTERQLPDNVKARLIAARRSPQRTVHLVAKFETMDKDKREILVEFHSTVATPHERTLMNLVEACVGGCGPGAGPTWRQAEVEAVFSIPKEGVRYLDREGYVKCYLVSMKLRKGD
jgi:hypothetical protein